MGGVVTKGESPRKAWIPETKIEAKMVEAMQRRASEGTAMKSFNSIILKFPKIDESFRNCKAIFQQFGMLYVFIELIWSAKDFSSCPETEKPSKLDAAI